MCLIFLKSIFKRSSPQRVDQEILFSVTVCPVNVPHCDVLEFQSHAGSNGCGALMLLKVVGVPSEFSLVVWLCVVHRPQRLVARWAFFKMIFLLVLTLLNFGFS